MYYTNTHFNHVCLCTAVLTVSLYTHLYRYEGVKVPDDENRYGMYHAFHLLCLVFIYCQEILMLDTYTGK